MKKGKKMPSIELDGHSDAKFMLVDGKIVRVDASQLGAPTPGGQAFEADRRLRGE